MPSMTSANFWKKFCSQNILAYMDCGQHILDISSKGTRALGFLYRNFVFATTYKSTKEVVYSTWVCPKLEYAEPIWNLYSKSKKEGKDPESIQSSTTPDLGY